MSDTIFTLEYFRDEVVRFRELFGSKEFWALSRATRDLAHDGLSLCYLGMTNLTPKERQWAADVFDATSIEFGRRETMMIRFNLPMGN